MTPLDPPPTPLAPAERRTGVGARPSPHDDRIAFAASWETYQLLAEAIGDQHVLLAYDGERLELMSPGLDHEIFKELVGSLVRTLAAQFNLPFLGAGSTRWRRPATWRGPGGRRDFLFHPREDFGRQTSSQRRGRLADPGPGRRDRYQPRPNRQVKDLRGPRRPRGLEVRRPDPPDRPARPRRVIRRCARKHVPGGPCGRGRLHAHGRGGEGRRRYRFLSPRGRMGSRGPPPSKGRRRPSGLRPPSFPSLSTRPERDPSWPDVPDLPLNRPPRSPSPTGRWSRPATCRRSRSARRGITRSSTGRWSIGPVGPRPPGRRRPRPRGRPRRPAARLRALERPLADHACGCSRTGVEPPGPRVLGASGSTAPSRLRRDVLGLDEVDRRLPRPPRRGGRPLGPDRRPVRRRALGRGLQPGHVPADRPDPRPAGRAGWGRGTSGSTSTSGSPWPRTSRAGRSPAPSCRRG